MLVKSREYKVMLSCLRFDKRKSALREFWDELSRIADQLGLEAIGEDGFTNEEFRTVRFLDTPAGTFRQNNLILRQRREFERRGGSMKGADATVTLKCRSTDRYLVTGQSLDPGPGQQLAGEPKFEEDIAAPFVSQFSHSVSIESIRERPATLADISSWFPCLGELTCNGLPCAAETPVNVVNNLIAHERVCVGPVIQLGDKSVKLALILWSHHWKSRPIAAEFSFRYGDADEQYSLATVQQAMQFFREVQNLDWCHTAGGTKTQIAYGG